MGEGGGRVDVLVVAPHPDDEAIGCGGAICLHVDRGDRVAVVFLTSGERGLPWLAPAEAWAVREREAGRAARRLGVCELTFLRCPDWRLGDSVDTAAKALRPAIEGAAPTIVYLPHPDEGHPDHRAALAIVRAALDRSAGLDPALRLYEISTPLPRVDQLTDITAFMSRKLGAIRCYRSQIEQVRYDHAVRGLNQYRGIQHHCGRYAEAFAAFTPPALTPPAEPRRISLNGHRRAPAPGSEPVAPFTAGNGDAGEAGA